MAVVRIMSLIALLVQPFDGQFVSLVRLLNTIGLTLFDESLEPDWLYDRMRETECYWRHCYERKESHAKGIAQAAGGAGDAMQSVESSKA